MRSPLDWVSNAWACSIDRCNDPANNSRKLLTDSAALTGRAGAAPTPVYRGATPRLIHSLSFFPRSPASIHCTLFNRATSVYSETCISSICDRCWTLSAADCSLWHVPDDRRYWNSTQFNSISLIQAT